MVPGIVAMALFFTASAVGPLITPWERQARTWERLATSPASIWAIIAGDVAAGMAFGVLISLVPLGFGIGLLGAVVVDGARLALGIGLGALAFSALGVPRGGAGHKHAFPSDDDFQPHPATADFRQRRLPSTRRLSSLGALAGALFTALL